VIGLRILSLMAVDLELPADFFADKVNYGNSILRALHYPPLPTNVSLDGDGVSSVGAEAPHTLPPRVSMRAAPHEDISLLTILIGATDAGLQVKGPDGVFIPVVSDSDTLVVNVGDMLQRLTNGVYRSATHQVVNPPSNAPRRSRYSVPFFLDPNPDLLIKAIPSTVSNRPELPPILAHDFLMERLREIKLA
jgi:isopenicillin N synthase-like dioxygenase